MKFESDYKRNAMKELLLMVSVMMVLTSCASSNKEESASRKPSPKEDRVVMQAEIKQAVEMRRFLIKFDRLYYATGGQIDLIPKANYIILDGQKVVISAAYMGRQFSNRPIRGIDMVGTAVSYELRNNGEKGLFEIRLKARNEVNTFDIFLTVHADGYCNASVTSAQIDNARYSGSFIPLKPQKAEEKKTPPEEMPDPVDLVI